MKTVLKLIASMSLLGVILVTGNEAVAQQDDKVTIGDSGAGGPSANIPRAFGRPIATCLDNAPNSSTRCSEFNHLKIADAFCRMNGYGDAVRNLDGYLWNADHRRSTTQQPTAYLDYNTGDFLVRESSGPPTFFLKLSCWR